MSSPVGRLQPLFGLLRYLIPCLLFSSFFTLRILNPTYIAWLLHDDWGQHFLGWAAYRQAPLHWPFNREYLLAAPTGISLIFTDSNPLMAFLARALNSHLPAVFQYIGLWFLLCILLQFHIAWRLVRQYAPGQWSAIAGATLLSLLPTLYNRVDHDTLMAHWLILSALYLFFNVVSWKKKTIYYGLVLAAAALVHPYILVMVFAIWGADQLSMISPVIKSRRWSQLTPSLVMATAGALSTGLALAASGAFDGSVATGGSFGEYAMSLDAPFNPVRKDFYLAFLRGGQYNGQAFEGFQYLGLGIMVLLGIALYAYTRSRKSDRAEVNAFQRARALRLPFLILLALAISNHVRLYQRTLINIPLPHKLVNIIGAIRCSGRLVWPLAYTAVFLALLVLYRGNRRLMTNALSFAILLQIVDVSRFAVDIRSLTARDRLYTYTNSSQWDDLVSHADQVSFLPASAVSTDAHKNMFFEIAYRALRNKIPVNAMYAARDNRTQQEIQKREYVAFEAGSIDPHHLYILANNCSAPHGLESHVRVLDGIWLIPPEGLDHLVNDVPSEPEHAHVGSHYEYNENSPATCQLDPGWAAPESGWVWSEGVQSNLSFSLEGRQDHDLVLSLRAATYTKGKPLDVLVNGVAVAHLNLTREPVNYKITIPPQSIRDGKVTMTFVVEPMSVKERKSKDEERPLGMRLYSLDIGQ